MVSKNLSVKTERNKVGDGKKEEKKMKIRR